MNMLESAKDEVKALNFKNIREVLNTMPKFIDAICMDTIYDHEMFNTIIMRYADNPLDHRMDLGDNMIYIRMNGETVIPKNIKEYNHLLSYVNGLTHERYDVKVENFEDILVISLIQIAMKVLN